MRDDFSALTKRLLAARVAHRCSRPICRAQTAGPQVDRHEVLNVGVAAHITAAAEGGPRYDPEMTPTERRHIDNGIWLCQTCARLIDNDVTRFPIPTLREWKKQAEEVALNEIGVPNTPSALLAPLRDEACEAATAKHVFPGLSRSQRWLRPSPRRLPWSIVDRQSLIARIRAHLDEGGQAVLQGPPGMGKTTLAMSASRELVERYPGGTIELQLGPDVTSVAEAEPLARILVAPAYAGRPDLVPIEASLATPQTIRTLLCHAPNLLVIIDDAWAANPVEALLACLPQSAHVLITTRDLSVAHRFGRFIAVEELEVEEAVELVEQQLPGSSTGAIDATIAPPESTAARALALAFGYHALALNVACSTIALKPREMWAAEISALADALRAGRSQGWNPGVWQYEDRRVPIAIEHSYRALAELENGTEACACYRSLGATADCPSVAAELLEAIVPSDHGPEVLDLLSRLSLIRKDVPTAGPPRVRIHSVIRSDALARQDDPERDHLAAVSVASVAAFVSGNRDNRWRVFDDIQSIRHAWTQMQRKGTTEQRSDFLKRVFPVLHDLGMAGEADEWTAFALGAINGATGSDRALCLVNRAQAHALIAGTHSEESSLRLRQAVACYDEALVLFAPDGADAANALNGKGVVLRDLAGLAGEVAGDCLREALQCLVAALPRRRGTPVEAAATLHNKGVVLRNLAAVKGEQRSERLADALASFQEALPLCHTSPSDYAATLTDMGTVLHDLADLFMGEQRLEHLTRAAACYDEALPLNSFYPMNYAQTLNDKAIALRDLAILRTGERRQRQLREAVACYYDALPLFEPYPSQRATTLANMSVALLDLAATGGEDSMLCVRGALACCDEAITLAQPTARIMSAILNNRANALRLLASGRGQALGDVLLDALSCYERVLELSAEFPAEYAAALNNRGTTFADLAAVDQAHQAEYLYAAISSYDAALWLRHRFPSECEETLRNKARVLMDLSGLPTEDSAARWEEAQRSWTEAENISPRQPRS